MDKQRHTESWGISGKWVWKVAPNLCNQLLMFNFFPTESCHDLCMSVRNAALHPPTSSYPQIQELLGCGCRVIISSPGAPSLTLLLYVTPILNDWMEEAIGYWLRESTAMGQVTSTSPWCTCQAIRHPFSHDFMWQESDGERKNVTQKRGQGVQYPFRLTRLLTIVGLVSHWMLSPEWWKGSLGFQEFGALARTGAKSSPVSQSSQHQHEYHSFVCFDKICFNIL